MFALAALAADWRVAMVKMVAKKLEKKPDRVSDKKLTEEVVKTPAHVNGAMFTYECRYCDFVAKSETSDRVARSTRDRHERERCKKRQKG